MRHRIRTLLILLFAAFQSSGLYSAPYGRRGVGTTGAQFLKLGVNARAIGMGEAYSTVSDGSDSIYWNPSRLGFVEGKAFSFMHAAYLQNVFYDYGSYAQSIQELGTFGLSVQYLSAPTINQVDEIGGNFGTFQPYDSAISVGWARKILDSPEEGDLFLGVAGKFIQSRIVEVAQSGAVDFGLSWNPANKFWLSLAAQNIGPALKFKDVGDDLPLNIKLGSAYQVTQPLLAALDVNFPKDNDPYVGIGAEYWKKIIEGVSVAGRLGFNSRTTPDIAGLNSLTSGVGFTWKGYGLDFAWVPFGGLGQSYRFSFSGKF